MRAAAGGEVLPGRGSGAAAGRTTQDTLTGRLSSSLGNIGGP
ncbi:hypothetical protein O1M54_34515 [Streptomyces diastatochromogenes]|nr:hypothetical protein [Streptomyces diastatochromogenes]